MLLVTDRCDDELQSGWQDAANPPVHLNNAPLAGTGFGASPGQQGGPVPVRFLLTCAALARIWESSHCDDCLRLLQGVRPPVGSYPPPSPQLGGYPATFPGPYTAQLAGAQGVYPAPLGYWEQVRSLEHILLPYQSFIT